MKDLRQTLLKNTSLGLGWMRSLSFTSQSTLLPFIDVAFGDKKAKSLLEFRSHFKTALPKVQALMNLDAQNIAEGLYPLSVIFQESPLDHYGRVPALIKDAIRAVHQRKRKKVKEFSDRDREFVDAAPEYYKRNFHFQNGGYLNDKSAKLYEHQVEILFSGTAQAMRRQALPPLKRHFGGSDGEGLKILEIASGTGALTRALALTFPKAQIYSVDASPHYLKNAKAKLSEFKKINYINAFAEDLDFKEGTFDAVVSCYLFHELPFDVREKVLKEQLRVLKQGGLVVNADSIQLGDDPELEWALRQFPVDFHEPFYKNYIENDLAELMQACGYSETHSQTFFLTKVVCGKKSPTKPS